MEARDDGLTLEGLAQRLEALERENTELRNEVVALRNTRGDGPAETSSLVPRRDGERAAGFEGLVSRKSLLSKAGAAAVAAVAAGTFLPAREAKAHHYEDGDFFLLKADGVLTHDLRSVNPHGTAVQGDTTSGSAAAVLGTNSGDAPGVEGVNAGTGPAVEGTANGSGGTGVKGTGRYGVWGESNQAGFYGVTGRNTRTDGTGVRGVGAKTGVLGESTNGIGVRGASSAASLGAVEGHNNGGGAGLAGVGKVGMLAFSHTDGWIAAWGRHTANGFGVAGDSARGAGVLGESTGGYGGQFKGGKAQLKLVPASTAGRPTAGTHAKGELYMDSKARLFVCVADGSPGTWKKVTVS